MVKYTIWLDKPTEIFYAAVKSLGGAVQDKDGLFTVRLVDKDRNPLAQKECSLSFSNSLDESYVYVSATPQGGLIKTGAISASRPFQGIEIRYQGVFTDRPLEPSQFGPLLYTVAPGSGSSERNYTITKIVQMDVAQESIQS